MAMLEVKDLHVSYGMIRAISGVSFTVNEGEIISLIGANGAGKTTILRTISGLERPQSGDILYQGDSIVKLRPEQIVKRGIAHVPEGRRIFTNMSVTDNLLLGANLRTGDKDALAKDIRHVFSLFPRLEERQNQNAGTLSGGEQQMLAVGRALMTKGTVMLLDEPSMGLAPMVVEAIFEIIRTINQQGTTILLVEQNANMAMQLSHRTYVLETGHIVLEGASSDLIKNEKIKQAYLGI